MTQDSRYKVGVIGLGAIAFGYCKPADDAPYCHVGGIAQSDRVRLAAVADMAPQARQTFGETWGGVFSDVKTYESSGALLDAEPLDILSVCVRGPHHYAVVMQILQHANAPRALFLEKPPSCSLREMDEMRLAARERQIPITVSYSRHWSPHVLRLQELVQEGLIGDVQSVVGYCGGPVLSFASHTTDLICQFAGYAPQSVSARGAVAESEMPAGFEPEPNLEHMTIEFKNGVLGVQIGAKSDHSQFYVDVFGTKGRVRAGIYIPPAAFDAEGEEIDLARHAMPQNASVFTVAYGQIADYLDGGALPHCTDDDFAHVNEIGFAAIESALTQQRITLPNTNRDRKIFANG